MRGIAKKWEDQYNSSIATFTGRNKIDALGPRGGPVVERTGGLVRTLAEAEKLDPGQMRLSDRTSSALSTYEDAIKDYVTEKRRYAGYIKDALKLVPKAAHPKAYRELKVLDTTLNALQALMENNHKTFKKSDETAKIRASGEKKQEKARAKGDDNAERAAQETAALKTFLVQLKTMGNSATRKGLAAIQKMKSDPTVATYNDIMDAAGRDVSQWVGNIDKLKRHPKLSRNSVVKKLASADAFLPPLTEFGNGTKRRLADDTDQTQVEAHIKEFSTLLKGVVTAYTPVLKFKE